MKKDFSKLNCFTKVIEFDFKGQHHIVDLKEGDLHDSWNSIDVDGEVFDTNFSWQEDTKPSMTIYPLRDNEDGTFSTDFYSGSETALIINEIVGCRGDYFDIPFDSSKTMTFLCFNYVGELMLNTKKFNKACDFTYLNDGILIAVDANGNTKRLSHNQDVQLLKLATTSELIGEEIYLNDDVNEENPINLYWNKATQTFFTIDKESKIKEYKLTNDPNEIALKHRTEILEYCLGDAPNDEEVSLKDIFIYGGFIKEVK